MLSQRKLVLQVDNVGSVKSTSKTKSHTASVVPTSSRKPLSNVNNNVDAAARLVDPSANQRLVNGVPDSAGKSPGTDLSAFVVTSTILYIAHSDNLRMVNIPVRSPFPLHNRR